MRNHLLGWSVQERQEEIGREYEQSTMVNMYTTAINLLSCIQLKNKRWQGAGYVQEAHSTQR